MRESNMKRYAGDRTIDGVKVTVDGMPLDPCTGVKQFTENGFEWSYEGPEPRQLALALLVDHLGDNEKAKASVEPFMQAVVANFENEWEMTSADIDEALAALSGKAVA
jgi:uncharacterized protein DUF6166